jgi:hypothetical protein
VCRRPLMARFPRYFESVRHECSSPRAAGPDRPAGQPLLAPPPPPPAGPARPGRRAAPQPPPPPPLILRASQPGGPPGKQPGPTARPERTSILNQTTPSPPARRNPRALSLALGGAGRPARPPLKPLSLRAGRPAQRPGHSTPRQARPPSRPRPAPPSPRAARPPRPAPPASAPCVGLVRRSLGRRQSGGGGGGWGWRASARGRAGTRPAPPAAPPPSAPRPTPAAPPASAPCVVLVRRALGRRQSGGGGWRCRASARGPGRPSPVNIMLKCAHITFCKRIMYQVCTLIKQQNIMFQCAHITL